MPPSPPAAADAAGRPRPIRRRLHLTPAFHQVDMMNVVHNVQFFYWFEQGRLQLMEEVLPLGEAVRLGVSMPVVENRCVYRRPVRYGDPLLLLTEHRRQPRWEGRLVFTHSLVHRRHKAEVASGRTTTTLVEVATGRLVRQWPAALWQRYQALAEGGRPPGGEEEGA